MLQLGFAIVTTVAVVLFSMANTHHVELSYVIGKPVTVRLIFLLSVSFVTGIASTLLYQLFIGVTRRRSVYRERRWSEMAPRILDED